MRNEYYLFSAFNRLFYRAVHIVVICILMFAGALPVSAQIYSTAQGTRYEDPTLLSMVQRSRTLIPRTRHKPTTTRINLQSISPLSLLSPATIILYIAIHKATTIGAMPPLTAKI